ncbi:MAG: NAD-binding protein [Candidatus Micrarchaeota archaeon]|nr:NAD-binding protein [Candidatus Micrarchaeota archaeon]
MIVAVIGTGRVGEQVVHELAKNAYINELLLIERTRDRAEGIRKDLIDEDPGYEEKLSWTET